MSKNATDLKTSLSSADRVLEDSGTHDDKRTYSWHDVALLLKEHYDVEDVIRIKDTIPKIQKAMRPPRFLEPETKEKVEVLSSWAELIESLSDLNDDEDTVDFLAGCEDDETYAVRYGFTDVCSGTIRLEKTLSHLSTVDCLKGCTYRLALLSSVEHMSAELGTMLRDLVTKDMLTLSRDQGIRDTGDRNDCTEVLKEVRTVSLHWDILNSSPPGKE